jgi:hypothetical protein
MKKLNQNNSLLKIKSPERSLTMNKYETKSLRSLTMNKYESKSLMRTALLGTLLILALHLATGPAAIGMVATNESIIGFVDETDSGYFIMTESEYYLVVGFDLSDMVGTMVEATGMITAGEGGKEIHATSVEKL